MRNCFFGERIKVQFNTFIGLNMVIFNKKKAPQNPKTPKPQNPKTPS